MKNYEIWNIQDFNNLLIKINPFIRNINKEIILSLPNKTDVISGVFLGIGENGGLKINKNNNIIEYFSIDNFSSIGHNCSIGNNVKITSKLRQCH